jgi:sphingomyelin phosphodiesterase
MNLTAANLAGAAQNPVWFELYQAKTEYGLADLSPKSMDDLFLRLVNDADLFQLYFK